MRKKGVYCDENDRGRYNGIWATEELYRPGNDRDVFFGILEKNMRPVYDSARRQGYEMWMVGC